MQSNRCRFLFLIISLNCLSIYSEDVVDCRKSNNNGWLLPQDVTIEKILPHVIEINRLTLSSTILHELCVNDDSNSVTDVIARYLLSTQFVSLKRTSHFFNDLLKMSKFRTKLNKQADDLAKMGWDTFIQEVTPFIQRKFPYIIAKNENDAISYAKDQWKNILNELKREKKEKLNELLFSSCENGTSDEWIVLLLAAGADPSTIGGYGYTALAKLIENKNLSRSDLVSLFLRLNVEVNKCDQFNFSALMSAVDENEIEGMKLLLDAKADVEGVDDDGFSVLTRSVVKDNFEAVFLLIQYGANVDRRDERGLTPLMHAAMSANEEIITFLVNYGADITLQDDHGRTAFDYFNERIKKQDLLKKNSFTRVDSDSHFYQIGDTKPRIIKVDAIKNVLVFGIFSHDLGYDSKEFMFYESVVPFVQRCFPDLIGVDCHPVIDAYENWDYMISELISHYQEKRNLSEYFSYARDCNISDIRSLAFLNRSFMNACLDDDNDYLARFLLMIGADINTKDENGSTAFMQAIKNDCFDRKFINTSLLKDVNLNEPDNKGKTPLRYAVDRGDINIVKAILFTGGVDVNICDNKGLTPLMAAIRNNDYESCCLLIKYDANVNAQDIDGNTPLIYAAQFADVSIVSLLRNKDADVSCKNNHKNTAFDYFKTRLASNSDLLKMSTLLAHPKVKYKKLQKLRKKYMNKIYKKRK